MNDNPRTRRLLVPLIFVSAILFVAAGGALLYVRQSPSQQVFAGTPSPMPAPLVDITPPASLDDLAKRYPEIANLLRDPTLGSAYKAVLVAFQQGGISAAEAQARDRGLLDADLSIRITLVLDNASNVSEVTAELQKFGIQIEGTYQNMIDISVPWSLVEQFAQTDNPAKLFAQLTGLNHIAKLRLPQPIHPEGHFVFNEGVALTGASTWQKAGWTGKGVKIGILDLGFDGYKKLLGTGLPANVTVKSFVPGKEPDQTGVTHGTACAEIVHEMAPDAQLFLANYQRLTQMPVAVQWLEQQGVQIISHSAGSEVGAMDGNTLQDEIVDQAASQGILWVNAAGNDAQSHYRFTFHDNGKGANLFPNNQQVMGIIPPQGGGSVALNWDDWTGNASEDYDLYVYDETGKQVGSSEEVQGGSDGDIPVEFVDLGNMPQKTYYVQIVAKHATRPAVFDLYSYEAKMEFSNPDHSLITPGDARGAFTLGAIRWNQNGIEPFSSQGPTNDNRPKPEMIAPDGVSSLVYSPDPFFGTSAATPQLSGAAALVKSHFPDASASDIEAFLESYSVKMGSSCQPTVCGYGRLSLPSPAEARMPTQARTPVAIVATPTVVRIATTQIVRTPVTVIPTLPPVATVPIAAPTLPPVATVSIAAPSPSSVPTTVAIAPPIGVPTAVVPPPVAAPPASGSGPNPLAMIGLVGFLSGLTCLGATGSVGGLAMLLFMTRKPRPAMAASVAPSGRAYSAAPAPAARTAAAPAPAVRAAPELDAAAASASRWSGVPLCVGADGRQLPLQVGSNQVGRLETNDIHIDDPQVSRRHAEIVWDGTNATIADLGSANGTLVNGQRLAPHQNLILNPGDRISIGPNSVWTVRSEG